MTASSYMYDQIIFSKVSIQRESPNSFVINVLGRIDPWLFIWKGGGLTNLTSFDCFYVWSILGQNQLPNSLINVTTNSSKCKPSSFFPP